MGTHSLSISTRSARLCRARRSSCSIPTRPRPLLASLLPPRGRLQLPQAPERLPPGNGAAPTRAAIILPWEKPRAEHARAAEARRAEAIGLAAAIGLVVV